MSGRNRGPARPVDAALGRLLDLATKGVPASRMAREVEIIVAEWRGTPSADAGQVREQVEELLDTLSMGVADAESQVADVDRSDAAAVKQADTTLAALQATRDAALRAISNEGAGN